MSTPGSPVVQHAYLVAHQDARFASNFRDTYALTLVTKNGMRLCHMASTWRSTSDVRSTCLHGYWCEACHPSHNFKLLASFRYLFQSQESTPDFSLRLKSRRDIPSHRTYTLIIQAIDSSSICLRQETTIIQYLMPL